MKNELEMTEGRGHGLIDHIWYLSFVWGKPRNASGPRFHTWDRPYEHEAGIL